MTAIRIAVTAEHIAAAGPIPPDDGQLPADYQDPVARAIGEVTGQDVECDGDTLEAGKPQHEIATIGAGSTTLVVDLPPEEHDWIVRYFNGEQVEPFEFSIEIEDWLVDLLGRPR